MFHKNIMNFPINIHCDVLPDPETQSPHMTGSGSGTGPLDYESRDPIPDPETLPFIYIFGQLSFYLKEKTKN